MKRDSFIAKTIKFFREFNLQMLLYKIKLYDSKQVAFGKLSDRLSFYEGLADLAEDKVPLAEVGIGEALTLYIKKKSKKRHVFAKIKESHKVQNLGTALQPHLPPLEGLLLATTLDRNPVICLKSLSVFTKRLSELYDTLKGMIYPSFLLIILLFYTRVVSLDILPNYEKQLPVERWPLWTQFFRSGTLFVYEERVIILITVVIVVILSLYSLPRYTGRFRPFLDKYWPFHIVYRNFAISSFTLTVSTMLNLGVTFQTALIKMREYSTPYLSYHIDIMRSRSNKEYDEMLDTGMFTEDIIDQVFLYKSANKMNTLLPRLGERTVRRSIKLMRRISGVYFIISILSVAIYILLILLSGYEITGTKLNELNLS